MAGLVPAIHVLRRVEGVDGPGIRAFTPVFDGLWPGMTTRGFDMTARIIDGKAIAEALRARVASEVSRLVREHGLTPGLAVVLVGENPASAVYVRNKGKQTL